MDDREIMLKEANPRILKGLRFLSNVAKKKGDKLFPKAEALEPWFKKHVQGADPHKAWKQYQKHVIEGGDESLLLWPFRALAQKLVKPETGKRIAHARWKYISKPALKADVALGAQLEKIPLIGKSLFRIKEDIPWGKGMKKEISRPSALAPLIKVRDLAEPILIGVGLEKGLKTLSELKQQGQTMKDQKLREKVASVMLSLHEKNKEHEKRAHALRLLCKQAELGYSRMPQTHSELETKLAALVNEDLVVLEKALELAGSNIKLGELGSQDQGSALTAAEKFQATILGDELL